MSFAKKLKEVVKANFVEISSGDDEAKPEKTAAVESAAAQAERLRDAAASTWTSAPAAAAARPIEAEDDLLLPTGPATAPVAAYLDVPAPEGAEEAPAVEDEPAEAEEEPAAAEAEEVAPAAAPVAENLPPDPLALIGENGTLNYEGIYARMAVPRTASFTAEQALSMLVSMPADLPLRIKRQTVKATLDAVGAAVGASPTDIVGDAERKQYGLEKFVDLIGAHAADLRAERESQIASLRAQIADIESELAAVERKCSDAASAVKNRIEQFGQVVAFFAASSEAVEEEADQDVEEAELPPFLQEDAVLRLLGIGPSAGVEDPEPAGVAAESSAAAV